MVILFIKIKVIIMKDNKFRVSLQSMNGKKMKKSIWKELNRVTGLNFSYDEKYGVYACIVAEGWELAVSRIIYNFSTCMKTKDVALVSSYSTNGSDNGTKVFQKTFNML